MTEKNWKNTLLMAKTDFSMKAQLTEKEPKYNKQWLERDIFQKVLKQNKENEKGSFVLHDGPPYANGNLHVGHALNKILKDIILRQKSLDGFFTPFIPGWDTHGLPIENKMLEELKMSKDGLNPLTLRKEAAKYAKKQIEVQKEQFKKMQLFCDFQTIYRTFDPNYEVGQLELFKKMTLEGLIYKGLKPVYWSPSSQSALAEAEVEYYDIRSPQIIVAMTVEESNDLLTKGDHLLIMTTTPWTLIANAGVAVGENFTYLRVKQGDNHYVVAEDLVDEIATLAKWESFEVINKFKGSEIAGVKYISPINHLTCLVIVGHHVATDVGTGLVHIAPLFGEDDFLIGKEHNLEMIMHIDDKGFVCEGFDKYSGVFYEDVNKEIGLDLDKNNSLLSLKFMKHSYPHDWRTNKPIIFRGVPQWFVNINKIKPEILTALKSTESKPAWGIKRIAKMIEGRSEWTISRQRTWGVPLIIFYDKDNNPVIKEDIFDYVINLVKDHGTDVWWEKEADELLPEQYRGLGYTKETDIMDVWFDSGSSHMSVRPGVVEPPFDLYLEGSDQYRGWFNSSLINSVAARGVSPYKKLISHGFVVDGKQQKMSKSKGNVIDPLTVIEKNGADVLRLWVANSDYTSDVTISNEILKQVIEIYRRIRNTIRFMLGNISDFDVLKDKVELKGVHNFVQKLTLEYKENVEKHYADYDFGDVVKITNKFFIDLSGWYFDYAKDALYCESKDSLERKSIQTNIYQILLTSLKAMAPILPTTMEEAYELIPFYNQKESIFLEKFEDFNLQDAKVEVGVEEFYAKYRMQANKALEEARKEGFIKRNNEAILTVDVPAEHRFTTEEEFAKMFIVAKVVFANEFKVEKLSNSDKCQRCWNHFDDSTLTSDNLCIRCENVVSKK